MTRLLLIMSLLLIALPSVMAQSRVVPVPAAWETAPIAADGDAADDPAIWLHPTDPAQSVIIGTNKQGGLEVYDLSGEQLQSLEMDEINTVDLRYNFPLNGSFITLIAATNNSDDTLELLTIDPETRLLEKLDEVDAQLSPLYGMCMYISPVNGEYYAFVNSLGDGEYRQIHLTDDGSGGIKASEVRRFDVGSQAEGCVADDALGVLYITEEERGIWKYGAEPDAGEERTLIDEIRNGNLAADLEGITLYYGGEGYLIVSSQGSSEFAVYERQGENAYLGSFQVMDGAVDGASGTDGIDVTNMALDAPFEAGMFVAQDNRNGEESQNFKLVAWSSIAEMLSLQVDTAFDPRGVGALMVASTETVAAEAEPVVEEEPAEEAPALVEVELPESEEETADEDEESFEEDDGEMTFTPLGGN